MSRKDKSKSLITVATHSGSFHLDDLLSVATISLLHPDQEIKVIRTRDRKIIEKADWVVDVGGEYNHETRRYDHHQSDSPIRKNGIPYAAFGLVWRHWGSELCEKPEIAQRIEGKFAQLVDASDNGHNLTKSLYQEGFAEPTISWLPILWRPTWREDGISEDDRFLELLPIVIAFLDRLITVSTDAHVGEERVRQAYQSAEDKEIIILAQDYPFMFLNDYPEPKFAIYPDDSNGTWKAKCITVETNSFACRVPFPASWRGLSGEKLQKVTGFSGAEFVHKAGFLAVASDFETVLNMCREALRQKENH